MKNIKKIPRVIGTLMLAALLVIVVGGYSGQAYALAENIDGQGILVADLDGGEDEEFEIEGTDEDEDEDDEDEGDEDEDEDDEDEDDEDEDDEDEDDEDEDDEDEDDDDEDEDDEDEDDED